MAETALIEQAKKSSLAREAALQSLGIAACQWANNKADDKWLKECAEKLADRERDHDTLLRSIGRDVLKEALRG